MVFSNVGKHGGFLTLLVNSQLWDSLHASRILDQNYFGGTRRRLLNGASPSLLRRWTNTKLHNFIACSYH